MPREMVPLTPRLCECGCRLYSMDPLFPIPVLNREDAEMVALIWDLGLRTFNANKRKRKRNMDSPGVRFT